jgi:hypothetical protein
MMEEELSMKNLKQKYLASGHPTFCTEYASLTTIGESFHFYIAPLIYFSVK